MTCIGVVGALQAPTTTMMAIALIRGPALLNVQDGKVNMRGVSAAAVPLSVQYLSSPVCPLSQCRDPI